MQKLLDSSARNVAWHLVVRFQSRNHDPYNRYAELRLRQINYDYMMNIRLQELLNETADVLLKRVVRVRWDGVKLPLAANGQGAVGPFNKGGIL